MPAILQIVTVRIRSCSGIWLTAICIIVLDRSDVWLTDERRYAIEEILYAGLARVGGSFSAEHGVGSKRTHALEATANPSKLALMALIKYSIDPHGLLNPGKIFASRN